MKFQGCFKSISRLFEIRFMCVSRMFQGFNKVARVFKEKVSKVFQSSFKVDSRKFEGVSMKV